MDDLLGPAAVLAALLGTFWVVLRGTRSGRRHHASFQLRSVASSNLPLVLVALELAEATFEVGLRSPDQASLATIGLIAAAALVVAVVAGRPGETLVGFAAIAVFLHSRVMHDGVVVGSWFSVVAIAMVIAASLLRRVLRR